MIIVDAEMSGLNPYKHSLVSIGAYLLSEKIFEYAPVKLTDREGEWGLPQTVSKMARDLPVAVVRATKWTKVTEPDDLTTTSNILKTS